MNSFQVLQFVYKHQTFISKHSPLVRRWTITVVSVLIWINLFYLIFSMSSFHNVISRIYFLHWNMWKWNMRLNFMLFLSRDLFLLCEECLSNNRVTLHLWAELSKEVRMIALFCCSSSCPRRLSWKVLLYAENTRI